MVTRVFLTELSPQLEEVVGRSWPRMLSLGLVLVLAAIFVLNLPRLIAGLIALVLLAAAGITLFTAYNLWNLSRKSEVDIQND